MIRGTEAPVLWRQAEMELFSLEKSLGIPYINLPVPKGSTRILEKDYLQGHVVT